MARPNRKTFQNRSYELINSIRSSITRGDYKPGDILPSENTLAKEFQLSKNSVRQALEKLVTEQLILKLPRIGNQVAFPQDTTTIRFGIYPSLQEEALMNELIALFHERYPHIKVETLDLPYNNPDVMRQLLQYGLVDMITINNSDFLHVQESGCLSLFEQLPVREDAYPFLNKLFGEQQHKASIRPFIFSPVILCYNKAHFEEKRILEPDSSWTWDDLYYALRNLKMENRFGLFFHLSWTNRWPIFLLQHGTRFSQDTTGWISPEKHKITDALHLIKDLIEEPGLFPQLLSFGYPDAELLLKQEKVSVIMTTYYRLKQLTDAEFPFEIAQLPKASTGDTLLLSNGIGVGSQSNQKEAAICFSDFLLSEEAQSHIRRNTFSLPASKWVTETVRTELSNQPTRLEIHREMIPNYATYEQLGLSMQQIQVLGDCLEQYFSGRADEDALIQLFNKQWNSRQEGSYSTVPMP